MNGLRPKYQRLKSVRYMLIALRDRKRDAESEIRTLDAAITFYDQMKRVIESERPALLAERAKEKKE